MIEIGPNLTTALQTLAWAAALAMVWAIGELQRNLRELMEKPGGGNVTLG